MELKSARSENGRHAVEMRRFFDHIERTPEKNTVKGMYVGGIWEALDSRGVTTPMPRIQKFKDYPLRDYMELLLDSALTLFPTHSPKDGLRALGRLAIPTFASSIVGGVIMSSVGSSWSMALKCVSKGYEVSLKPGKATPVNTGPNTAVLELRDVWNFGDSYQAGVVEGLMEWCDIRGTVTAQVLSPSSCDLHIQWAAKASKNHKASHTSQSSSPSAL